MQVDDPKHIVGGNARESRFRITDSRGGEFASFDLKRYGAEAAFKSLQDGSAVIGLATRPISLQETSALTQTRPQLRIADFEHVLGLDGLVVIVPPGSPATALSVDAIARIFSGTVTNWSAVGLPAGPINIYISSERTGSADTFADLVLKPRALTLSAAATRVADEAELSDAVARDPNAIGITSFAFLRNARGLDIVTPCGIVAKPTPFAVKAEEYPLGRRIYLYTAGQPAQPAAQELVRFVVSRRAQEIIRDAAFIDQSIESTPFLDQKPRIDAGLQPPGTIAYAADQVRQFVGEVGQARRLSVTFRFAMGDTRLDAKARGDLGRLAELLKSPEMSGKTVVFAGFTDVVGKPWLNQMLSLKRAQEVRDAILQSAPGLAAGKKILAFGYGPAAPVVCNESERADQNRRVEVWIRDEPATAVAARPTGGTALTQTPDPAAQPAAAAKTGRKKRFR
jgi:phosphate transport system substrate-binding protein